MDESVAHTRRVFKRLLEDFLGDQEFLGSGHDLVVWRPRFVQGNLETLYTSIEERNLGMDIGEGLAGSVANERKPESGSFTDRSDIQHPKTVKKYGWKSYSVSPVLSMGTLVGIFALYSRQSLDIPSAELKRFERLLECGLLLVDNATNASVKDQSLEKSLLALEIGKAAEDRFHDIKEALFLANGAMNALKKTRQDVRQFNRNASVLTTQLDKARGLSEKYILEAKNPNLLSRSEFDLKTTVRALVKELELRSKQRASHRQRKIDVHLSIPDTSVKVVADLERIDRAISNILANAEHWVVRSPTGTVRIDVTLTTDDDFCYLRIFDTGPGIIEPQRALEKGYSLREGTGLGLSIAKRVFELHDGSLSIKSDVPDWTSVELMLPRGGD